MKIRTDFVTNSSSSSFSLLLTVTVKDGSTVSYEDHPDWENGGEARFDGVLRELSVQYLLNYFQNNSDREYVLRGDTAEKERMRSVLDGEELKLIKGDKYTTLMNNAWVETYQIGVRNKSGVIGWFPAHDEISEYLKAILEHPGVIMKATAYKPSGAKLGSVKLSARREEGFSGQILAKDVAELAKMLMDSTSNSRGKTRSKGKQSFSANMKKQFSSLDQIESITVAREYSGWGEGAQLIPENDQTLRKMSERVIESDGEEKQKALQEMRDYITAPNGDRQHMMLTFGRGFDDFRYVGDTDDHSLLNIAKRLCSHHGPNSVGGNEFEEIRFGTGERQAYAEFYLRPYTIDMGIDTLLEEDIRKKLAEEREKEALKKDQDLASWKRANGDVFASDPNIVIPDHTFVFLQSGPFWGDHSYEDLVKERGGIVRSSVSGKTDYLVVIPHAAESRDSKVADAIIQQQKGKPVQIVLFDDFLKALDN